MQTLLKALLLFLVIVGCGVWATSYAFTRLPEPKEQTESPLVASVSNATLPYDFAAEGVLVRYQTADIPTYYLLYESKNGRFLKKELRFVDERGCSAQAGDLPCVFRYDPNEPPVPIGSYVRVMGDQDAQRIIVNRLRVVDDTTGSFTRLMVASGDVLQAGDITIEVHSVTDKGACKVFSGCFNDGIPRASFTYHINGRDEQKTFAPGMFMDVGAVSLVLIAANPETQQAVFVIARKGDV